MEEEIMIRDKQIETHIMKIKELEGLLKNTRRLQDEIDNLKKIVDVRKYHF